MTEGLNHGLEEQITSKMHELIACMCVVDLEQEGDRRGIIERIESLTLGKDFAESFDRSQFKVHLTSGDVVTVSGSAISEIESPAAGSDSTHITKELGRKARKARTESSKCRNAGLHGSSQSMGIRRRTKSGSMPVSNSNGW